MITRTLRFLATASNSESMVKIQAKTLCRPLDQCMSLEHQVDQGFESIAVLNQGIQFLETLTP